MDRPWAPSPVVSVPLQFLQDILDTLFVILDDNTEKYGLLVFQSLVSLILLGFPFSYHIILEEGGSLIEWVSNELDAFNRKETKECHPKRPTYQIKFEEFSMVKSEPQPCSSVLSLATAAELPGPWSSHLHQHKAQRLLWETRGPVFHLHSWIRRDQEKQRLIHAGLRITLSPSVKLFGD